MLFLTVPYKESLFNQPNTVDQPEEDSWVTPFNLLPKKPLNN